MRKLPRTTKPYAFQAAPLCALALVAVVMCTVRPTAGQDVFLASDAEIDSLIARIGKPSTSETPSDVARFVEEACERIRERGTVFFVRPDGRPRDARLEIRARIAALPPEYSCKLLQLFEPAAARALNEAADPENGHLEVARSHRICPCARESSSTLARMAFERGEPDAALRWLHDAADQDGFRPGPDSFLAALCYQQSGFASRAAAIAARSPRARECGAVFSAGRRRAGTVDRGFVPVSAGAYPVGADETGSAAGRSASIPCSSNELLFYPFPRGIACFDRHSGALAWRFPEMPALFSAGGSRGMLCECAVSGGELVACMGTCIAAFAPASGRMLWRFGSSDFLPAPADGFEGAPKNLWNPVSLSSPCPVPGGFAVVAVAQPGAMESWLLVFEHGGRIRRSLFLSSCPPERMLGSAPSPGLVVEGSTAYAATGTGAAVAVDIDGPSFLWGRVLSRMEPAAAGDSSRRAPFASGTAPVAGKGAVYLTAAETGRIDALDKATGEVIWSRRLGARCHVAGLDGDVLVALWEDAAAGLDRVTGRILWKTVLPGGPSGMAAVTEGRVHVPATEGLLTLLTSDGSLAAALDLESPGPFNLAVGRTGLLAGFSGAAVVFADGSSAESGASGFESAASTGRFAAAAALAPSAPSAAALLGACRRASKAGETKAATLLLDALESAVDRSDALIASARIAVAASEAAAGSRIAALDRLASCSGLKGSAAGAHGAPWSVSALALREAAALLKDPATAARWNRLADDDLASAKRPVDRATASVLRARRPLTRAADMALAESAASGFRSASTDLWLRWTSEGRDRSFLLDAFTSAMSARSPAEAGAALTFAGRDSQGDGSGAAPSIADWPLAPIRHLPAPFAESSLLYPRGLSVRGGPPPELYARGRDFVHKLDPRTGTVQWRANVGSFSGKAARAGGLLLVAASSALIAIDEASGIAAWTATLLPEEAASVSSPGSEGDFELLPGVTAVAAAFRDGMCAGFDLDSGSRRWSSRAGAGSRRAVLQDPVTGYAWVFLSDSTCRGLDPEKGPAPDAAFGYEGVVIAAGAGRFLSMRSSGSGTVVSLRALADGAAVWEKRFEGEQYQSAAADAFSGAAILLPLPLSSPPLPIRCISLDDGSTLCQLQTSSPRPEAVLRDSRVYLTFSDSVIQAFDAANGRMIWSSFVSGSRIVPRTMACTAWTVSIGTRDGGIRVLCAETGAELGALGANLGSALSVAGAGPLLFACLERGSAIFGPPLSPEELALRRFSVPGERERFLFEAAGRPWAGVREQESRARCEGMVGLSGSDPLHLALRGAVESAAFTSKPEAVARRFPSPVDVETFLEAPWSLEDSVFLRAGALRFVPEGASRPAWGGDSDLSARVYLGWDAKSFHILVDATDDRQVGHDRRQGSWNGDIAVVAVDMLCDGGFSLGADDMLFWAFRSKEQGPAPDDDGDDPRDERENRDLGGLKIRERPGGQLYRFSLPWEDFFNNRLRRVGLRARQISPRPGVRIGLNLLLLDDDGRGVKKMLAMSPGLPLPEPGTGRLGGGVWPELWTTVVLK